MGQDYTTEIHQKILKCSTKCSSRHPAVCPRGSSAFGRTVFQWVRLMTHSTCWRRPRWQLFFFFPRGTWTLQRDDDTRPACSCLKGISKASCSSALSVIGTRPLWRPAVAFSLPCIWGWSYFLMRLLRIQRRSFLSFRVCCHHVWADASLLGNRKGMSLTSLNGVTYFRK